MESAMIWNKGFKAEKNAVALTASDQPASILTAEPGQTHIIKDIKTEDEEMNAFLFRLGCYSGEPITLISKKKKVCIVVIKDGRYTLDNQLCEAILV